MIVGLNSLRPIDVAAGPPVPRHSLKPAIKRGLATSGVTVGKAGAYAIQGRAARFIDRIEGSWANVVGLPIATLYRLLKELGEVVS